MFKFGEGGDNGEKEGVEFGGGGERSRENEREGEDVSDNELVVEDGIRIGVSFKSRDTVGREVIKEWMEWEWKKEMCFHGKQHHGW